MANAEQRAEQQVKLNLCSYIFGTNLIDSSWQLVFKLIEMLLTEQQLLTHDAS